MDLLICPFFYPIDALKAVDNRSAKTAISDAETTGLSLVNERSAMELIGIR